MTSTYRLYDTVYAPKGRDSYTVVERLIAQRQPVKGSSLSAIWNDGQYVVVSYNTVIATVDTDGTVEIAKNHWGPTTGRHINICKRAL